MEEHVAKPLGVSVEEAALLAKRVVDASMGGEIYKEIVPKGFDPRDFILFAVGGGGPVHATGFASFAQLDTIVVFRFALTFCAYGSATMDLIHLYEKSSGGGCCISRSLCTNFHGLGVIFDSF